MLQVMTNKEKFKLWLKRIGWAGFFFFLIKGLIWLALLWFAGDKIF